MFDHLCCDEKNWYRARGSCAVFEHFNQYVDVVVIHVNHAPQADGSYLPVIFTYGPPSFCVGRSGRP